MIHFTKYYINWCSSKTELTDNVQVQLKSIITIKTENTMK